MEPQFSDSHPRAPRNAPFCTRATRRRLQPLAVSIGLAVALLVSLTASASATVYEIDQCAKADRTPTELAPSLVTSVAANAQDGCQGGTGYQVTAPANAMGGTWPQTGILFQLPAAMATAQIRRIWTEVSVAPKAAGAGSAGWFGGMNETTPAALGDLESFDTNAWPGHSHTVWDRLIPSGTRAVGLLVSCASLCGFSTSPTMTLYRAVVAIDDSTIPNAASSDRTGLLNGSGQIGTRVLTVNTSDGDSGVSSIRVSTDDGRVLGTVARGGACSYTRPIPCPQSWDQAAIAIDTGALSAGAHTLNIETFDAAGNRRVTPTPDFTVGPLPSLPEAAAASPASVVAGNAAVAPGGAVVDREQKMATAHYGATVTITGKLADGLGQPLGSVPLTVYERVQRLGDPWQRVAQITSDPQGSYIYRASASASKTLRFVYQGSRDGRPYTATREVVLEVHAKMTIGAQRHSIARRGTMRLTGRVGLSELPKAGTWVQIQVRDGGQWRTIDTRRTTGDGRWRYTHAMTKSANTTFQFRAQLQTSEDVPSLPSSSASTRVHVR